MAFEESSTAAAAEKAWRKADTAMKANVKSENGVKA